MGEAWFMWEAVEMEGRLSWATGSLLRARHEGHTQRLAQEAQQGWGQETALLLHPCPGQLPAQVIFSPAVPFLSHVPTPWGGVG